MDLSCEHVCEDSRPGHGYPKKFGFRGNWTPTSQSELMEPSGQEAKHLQELKTGPVAIEHFLG